MPYMKDEMKKKDSDRLDEMKQEINEAISAEDESKAAESSDNDTDTKSSDENNDAVADADKALADAQEQFKRLQADFVNFRRRSNQEKAEISNVILQGFVKDMLPILDNFERAVAAEGDDNALKEGVKMIFTQFNEVLVKNGLEVIKTEGEKFDPNFHQAVMRVEDAEKEDNTIDQELQKGYMVKGRVVRPAMVKVVSNN
ncbi:nucleotide exchange factor GrpE [Pectinatus brassicae]|uniref:Protein GrpE n=1 Tax=Pectinatus brassicae TaxID=862415 RepID=A0A840UGR4_9FIRM|nr:nucleotide exchange factor GrpE [Pectinatus brassicae]MBB5335380.1 molecular chaperone GrpE [Pectinatus brassicae]